MKFPPNTLPPFKWSLAIAFAMLVGFSSCDNSAQKRQKDLDDLNAYVKNQNDSIDQSLSKNWNDIQSGYDAKIAELQKDTAKMTQDMRNSYYQTQSQWESYKAAYTKKTSENKNLAAMDALRKSLAIDGVRSDYTNLTAAQVLPEFEHFVTTVKNNKDAYTADQWTAVNVNWKALKGRKRELSKDIPASDMAKILKQQTEYVGVKAANRTFADDDDDMKM